VGLGEFLLRLIDVVDLENDAARPACLGIRSIRAPLRERQRRLRAVRSDCYPTGAVSHRRVHRLFPTQLLRIEIDRPVEILRHRLFFSALICSLLLIPTFALYRELSRRPDIWWTPLPMALSLSESQDRVQIYVRGKPLAALLEARQLSVTDENGASPLGAQE